jgi:hypothetical protein
MENFWMTGPTVVAGDFNDNVLWDKPQKLNNHGTNVRALTAFGLRSAYHQSRDVNQGQEPEPTIFWRNRKIDGPRYHIDYCFVPESWINEDLAVDVGHFQDWVGASTSPRSWDGLPSFGTAGSEVRATSTREPCWHVATHSTFRRSPSHRQPVRRSASERPDFEEMSGPPLVKAAVVRVGDQGNHRFI